MNVKHNLKNSYSPVSLSLLDLFLGSCSAGILVSIKLRY